MSSHDPRILKNDICRSVQLSHEGCASLRKAGISGLGIDWRCHASKWGPGISNTHLIFFVCDGTFALTHSDQCVSQSQCLLIPASTSKRFVSPIGGKAVYMHFSQVNRWRLMPSQANTFPAVTPSRFAAIVSALIDETAQQSESATRICRQWSDLLLSYLARQFDAPTITARRNQLDAVLDHVKDDLQHPWTICELAGLAHMSEGHFHRQVQMSYGQSPKRLIKNLRLNRAIELLRNTDMLLDDIANHIGYATGFALSNAMHKEFNVRPQTIRQQ